jgi:ABC-type uncharacterized transport system involved in gliding motility auxiliary subunit
MQLSNLTRIRYILVTILILLTIISCICTVSAIGITSTFIEITTLLISGILIAASIITVDEDYKQYMNSLIDHILEKIC